MIPAQFEYVAPESVADATGVSSGTSREPEQQAVAVAGPPQREDEDPGRCGSDQPFGDGLRGRRSGTARKAVDRPPSSSRSLHERKSPGSLLPLGFAGTEVDAYGSEFLGAARLRGSAKNLLAPGDLELCKTGGHDRGL